MPKDKLKSEWKLWLGLGAAFLLFVVCLYFASRPREEGGEPLWYVEQVTGHDRLRLKSRGQTVEMKLVGLEIPASQAPAVKALLEKTLKDEWVRLKTLRDEPDGIKAGFVYLAGEDIHSRLIRQGMAKVIRGEQGLDVRPYIELEMEAQKDKRGLWAEAGRGEK